MWQYTLHLDYGHRQKGAAWDHVALKQDLEDLPIRKVNVVSDRALHGYIWDWVLADCYPFVKYLIHPA